MASTLAPCEFHDQVTGEVSIPSSWKREVTVTEDGTQTAPLKTKATGVQTAGSSTQADGGSQVRLDKETETLGPLMGQASLVGLQYVYQNTAAYSEERLAAFLESRRDALLQMLNRNVKNSSVFEHYEPNWSRKSTELSAVLTLSSPHAMEGELHALDIAWNASGTVLAVAYGRMDTSGWCYSGGYVCLWNLMRPDMDASNPHYTLEVDTYATAVAFHPRNAFTLAVGTYSGEVVVFLNVTESVPTSYSSINGGSPLQHQEPITKLQWLRNPQELRESHRYLLCSAALDGQLLYWTPSNKLSAAVSALEVRNKRHAAVGVTALAYLHQEQARLGAKDAKVPNTGNTLVLGFESGEVGRGQTLMTTVGEPTPTTSTTPLTLDWVDGHRGPVQAISASPFFRHLFASCSSDGAARVYSDLERAPLLTLEPSTETKHFLYSVQFSPFRPAVLSFVSRSSYLFVYDLQASPSRPLYSMEAGVDGSAVVSLRFNEASPDWMATGDTRGCVRVWRVPTEASQPTEQERAAVRLEQHAGGKGDTAGASAKEALRQLFGFSL